MATFSSPVHQQIHKRQNNFDGNFGEPGIYDGWWYSDAGFAVRYAITAAIILLVLSYFIGGYVHGRHRVKKGKPLLRYHKWMFRRSAYQHPSYAGRAFAAGDRSGAWRAQSSFGPQPPYYGPRQVYEMQPGVYRPGQEDPELPAYNADVPPTYMPPAYAPPKNGGSVGVEQVDGRREQEGEDSAGSSVARPAGAAYRLA